VLENVIHETGSVSSKPDRDDDPNDKAFVETHDDLSLLQNGTKDILHNEVAAMKLDNFVVRSKIKHVEHFKKREMASRMYVHPL